MGLEISFNRSQKYVANTSYIRDLKHSEGRLLKNIRASSKTVVAVVGTSKVSD